MAVEVKTLGSQISPNGFEQSNGSSHRFRKGDQTRFFSDPRFLELVEAGNPAVINRYVRDSMEEEVGTHRIPITRPTTHVIMENLRHNNPLAHLPSLPSISIPRIRLRLPRSSPKVDHFSPVTGEVETREVRRSQTLLGRQISKRGLIQTALAGGGIAAAIIITRGQSPHVDESEMVQSNLLSDNGARSESGEVLSNPLDEFSFVDGTSFMIDRELFLDHIRSLPAETTVSIEQRYKHPEDPKKYISQELINVTSGEEEYFRPNAQAVRTVWKKYDQEEREYMAVDTFDPKRVSLISYNRSDDVKVEDTLFDPNLVNIANSGQVPTFAEVSFGKKSPDSALYSDPFFKILHDVNDTFSGLDAGTPLILDEMPDEETLVRIHCEIGPVLLTSLATQPEEAINEGAYDATLAAIFDRRMEEDNQPDRQYMELLKNLNQQVVLDPGEETTVEVTLVSADNFTNEMDYKETTEATPIIATVQRLPNVFRAIDGIRGREMPYLALPENYSNPRIVFQEVVKSLLLNEINQYFNVHNPCLFQSLDLVTRNNLRNLTSAAFALMGNSMTDFSAIERLFDAPEIVEDLNVQAVINMDPTEIADNTTAHYRKPTAVPTPPNVPTPEQVINPPQAPRVHLIQRLLHPYLLHQFLNSAKSIKNRIALTKKRKPGRINISRDSGSSESEINPTEEHN